MGPMSRSNLCKIGPEKKHCCKKYPGRLAQEKNKISIRTGCYMRGLPVFLEQFTKQNGSNIYKNNKSIYFFVKFQVIIN
jgi:hypothetical protein